MERQRDPAPHGADDRDVFVESLLDENARLREALAVPDEVIAQLDLNLAILDDADALYQSMSPSARARIESATAGTKQRGLVVGLAFLPAESRDRIRRCVSWLRQRAGGSAPALRSPCPLRLLPPVPPETAALTASRR